MNKVIIVGIAIIILGLISIVLINGEIEERNKEDAEIQKLKEKEDAEIQKLKEKEAAEIQKLKEKEAAEIQKLKESAVDLIWNHLKHNQEVNPPITCDARGCYMEPNTVFTDIPTIYEGKIAYIEGQVYYAEEQNENYLSIGLKIDSEFKHLGTVHGSALLKLVNNNHNWKCGDTFEAYVKVLPHSEYYRTLSPAVDEYQHSGLYAKFSGYAFGGGGLTGEYSKLVHFEEIKMMSIDSENPKCTGNQIIQFN